MCCKKCKTKIEEDFIYCFKCSSEIKDKSASMIKCVRCGKSIEKDSHYCMFCGNEVAIEEKKEESKEQEYPEQEYGKCPYLTFGPFLKLVSKLFLN